jgi:hypothetical protein
VLKPSVAVELINGLSTLMLCVELGEMYAGDNREGVGKKYLATPVAGSSKEG